MSMAMEPGSEPEIVPPLVPPPALAISAPMRSEAPPALEARPPASGDDPARSRRPRHAAPPGLFFVLGHGIRRVFSQPWLLLFIWGLSFLTAMAASSPAMVMLGMLLGKRPAAVQLARGEADALFGEILEDHPVAVAIIVASVFIAATLFFFTHLVLSGGLLSALRRPGHPQRVGTALNQIVARGLATTGAMLRLEVLFLFLVRGPIVLVFGGLTALGMRSKYPDTHSLPDILAWVGPVAGLALWVWCGGTVVLYAARLQRLAQTAGEDSGWRALMAGLRLTLGSLAAVRVSMSLAFASAAGMAGLVIVGRMLAARLDYALLVIAALLVRQGFALLRSLLTLWIMASTVELCSPADGSSTTTSS